MVINVVHLRNRYGCMLYNNGRLIEMYVKTAVQKEKNDLMMWVCLKHNFGCIQ